MSETTDMTPGRVEALLRRLMMLELALSPDPDDYDVDAVKEAAATIAELRDEVELYMRLSSVSPADIARLTKAEATLERKDAALRDLIAEVEDINGVWGDDDSPALIAARRALAPVADQTGGESDG